MPGIARLRVGASTSGIATLRRRHIRPLVSLKTVQKRPPRGTGHARGMLPAWRCPAARNARLDSERGKALSGREAAIAFSRVRGKPGKCFARSRSALAPRRMPKAFLFSCAFGP